MVFIVITVITSTVAKTAHQSTEIGSFDRAAGLAFGILRGVLVVSLFVLLMRQTTARTPRHLQIPCRTLYAARELTLSMTVSRMRSRRYCRRPATGPVI